MARSGLLGKKLGMTQIYNESGQCIPVTVLQVGPCTVVQKKTAESDGYSAVQIGFGEIPERKVNKPKTGHFAKASVKPYRHLKEITVIDDATYSVGQQLGISLVEVGDKVDVIGISKGKGFQGVVKRHGFAGGPKSHGSHFHRVPGSIGQCTSPGEVHKGQKMPGRMGGDQVTVRNLKIVGVRAEENLLLARGAVPGPNDGLIFIRLNDELFEGRIKEQSVAASQAEEVVAEAVEDKVDAAPADAEAPSNEGGEE